MKRTSLLTVTLCVFLALTVVAAQKQSSPEALLGAAIHQEEAEGNLEAAIASYKKFLAQYANNRPLAAKAQYHLGLAYEKLGNAEARKAYEKLLRDYGDQTDIVTEARNRLAAMPEKAANGPAIAAKNDVTARDVWTGPQVDVYGTISPDGRSLTFVNWESGGNLAVRDMKTGVNRDLTTKDPNRKGGEAEWSTISRDGKQVAYSWGQVLPNGYGWRYDVWLANLTGAPNPHLLYGNEDVSTMSPYDWSPDGKWLAVSIQRLDRTAQIGLLSVHDGTLRVLKSVDWRGSGRMFFSPDGKYLAYDLPASDSGRQRDIFVLAIDGSRETPVVVDPSQDIALGWSPDGTKLLFTSDRTGRMSLWALPFRNGQPAGAPQLIKANIGDFETSMGLTASGALYLGVTGNNGDVGLATIDWDAGRVPTSTMSIVNRFVGRNFEPSWSSDGKSLVYISGREGRILEIFSPETEQLTELRPKMSNFDKPRLSPDRRSVLVLGTDFKGRSGYFKVDAQTGDAIPIHLGEGPSFGAEWSPDGTKVYFPVNVNRPTYSVADPGDLAYIEQDLASGKERQIIRRSNLAGYIFISPDGRWIATGSNAASGTGQILLIPIESGEPRELVRADPAQGQRLIGGGWTPDGKAVMVMKDGKANPAELWRIPIDGTEAPQKITFETKGVATAATTRMPIRLSPDGQRIAFQVSGAARKVVTVFENFLTATATNN